ncbi:MAG: rhamnulokinase [Candidatus Symbiothrix sp.]|jgi:rhamnulokinase|nr:rhamnulokinase [Candidatus Symbiothrix sp.]
MKDKYHFFAADLGATSGRTIVCSLDQKTLELREINRFANHIIEVNGHFYWNFLALYQNIIEGLKIVANEGIEIQSIGIDTWGVDFVCFDQNGEIFGNPYSYRDPHTQGAKERFFEQFPAKKLYDITGVQFMDFNSLFQFYTMRNKQSAILSVANKILFLPDALSYMLTGEMVTEYSIASTSQMIDARRREFSNELLHTVGLKKENFGRFVYPATQIGVLTDSIRRQTGLGAIPVVAVAGHDTASAVAAVPATDEQFAYLSSGTWSLMGIELREPVITDESYRMNYTNEGGIDGTIRYLKNITGMWLLEQCRKEWENAGKKYSYDEISRLAQSIEGGKSLIDPDHPSFANPESMTRAIADYCRENAQSVPQTDAQIIRCIFDSLAEKYRQTLKNLQHFAPYPIKRLHVIGGGSQNNLLNQFTANAIGIPVIAGPSEATAIGNALVQARGLGIVGSLQEMREIIRNSVQLKTYYPDNK